MQQKHTYKFENKNNLVSYLNSKNFKKLLEMFNNLVQIDETSIDGKNENRHCHTKKELTQGRSKKNATVLCMLQDGNVKRLKMGNTNNSTLVKLISEHIEL
jgi:hypothetical protein